MQREQQWHIQALAECRLKIRTRKYRVPDVIVLPADASRPEDAIEQPPLLCIEVDSPKDQLAELVIRAGDYLLFKAPSSHLTLSCVVVRSSCRLPTYSDGYSSLFLNPWLASKSTSAI